MPPKKQKSLKAMLSAPPSTAPPSTAPPQPSRGPPPPSAPPLELESPSAAIGSSTHPPTTAPPQPSRDPPPPPPPPLELEPPSAAIGSSTHPPTAAASPPPQATDPPPQAPSLVITSGSSIATPEDGPFLSIRCKNNGGEGSVKYRTVVSAKTNRIKRASGKIKVTWSDFTNDPTHETYSKLVRDIGAIVKTNVPTLAPSWAELEKQHQDILLSYLKNMYQIHPEDTPLDTYIRSTADGRYRDWKYRCHKFFKVYGTAFWPSEFKHRPEQWNWLVQHEFMPEAKRAISERNQRNRTNNPNPMNHRSGSKPLTHRAEDYKTRKPAPHLHATIHAYENCPNAREKMDSLKSTLKEIEDTQTNMESKDAQALPISVEAECEILINCFGERRGTEVRGMGRGVRRPPKKRGGSWSMEGSSKRQELEERVRKADERADRAEERLKNAEETAKHAIEQANETQKRIEALEQLVRQSHSSTNP